MENEQQRTESVPLDAPQTVKTTVPSPPKAPAIKQIPWKWVIGAVLLIVALVVGLLLLRSFINKRQPSSNNLLVKTQDIDLGKITSATLPLKLDQTDRVVINGQLQTNQGIVITPSIEPTASVLGQVYLDSATGNLRYYDGTQYLTIANTNEVGLTEVEVLALITAQLPQDLATTASPLFVGLNLSGANGNTVLLQAAAGTNNFALTLPANGGTANQCLTTNGNGALSFSACATGSGNAFLQGGNAFAATGVLGTTDNNSLSFITNNINRMTVLSTGNIGIGTTPSYKLDVAGDVNIDVASALRIGGVPICIVSGCISAPGSTNYINNTATIQSNSNFAVQSAGDGLVGGTIRANSVTQTADLLQLQISTGTNVVKVGATGNVLVQPSTNSILAFTVQNAAGTSNTLIADTTNNFVGIGTTPSYKLDVAGDVNIEAASALRFGGAVVCTASGCTSGPSSGYYIQNSNGSQANANFNIQSANASYVGGKIQGAVTQTADLLQLQISTGTNVVKVGATGNVLVQPSTNSILAFTVQNAAGTSNTLIADTTNNFVGIGTTPSYKLDVAGDVNIEAASALRFGGAVVCTASGCTSGPSSGYYIQNSNGSQANANFNIQSANASYVGGKIQGAVTQTADLLQIQNSAGSNLFKVDANGYATFQNSSNNTAAFNINKADSTNIFRVDTTAGTVNATNLGGDAFIGTTSNSLSYGVTGTQTAGVGGGIKGVGGGGYGVFGQSASNASGLFQTSNVGGTNGVATLIAKANTSQTSNLIQAQNTSGTAVFSVDMTGGMQAISLERSSSGTLSIGTTANTTAITIGSTGVTTTNNGALTVTQLLTGNLGATIGGGAITLTGTAASSFTTSSGELTLGTTSTADLILRTNSGTNGQLTLSGNLGAGVTTLTGTGATTLNSAAGSALAIGATSTGGAINIGGALTTGMLNLGSASQTNGIALLGPVSGNVTFLKEAAHTISIAQSTMAAADGGALSIVAGAATTTTGYTGGALNLTGGSASYNGALLYPAGGAVNITGGASTIHPGSGGGAVNITGGGGNLGGGNLALVGGSGLVGGNITLYAGTGAGAGPPAGFGGNVTIRAGYGNTPGVINIGEFLSSGVAHTGTISIGTGTGAHALNFGTGSTGIKTIAIGGTAANVITIGNTQTGGSIAMGAAMTTGSISIGGAMTSGTISIGTGTGAHALNFGTGSTGIKTIAIGGTAANVITIGNTQTGGSIAMGAAMTTGTISIGGTGAQTGTISIGIGTGDQTIFLGTGTGAKSVSVGSTNSASSLILQSGTVGITFMGHIISGNSSGGTTFVAGTAACTGGIATSSVGNDTAGKIIVTTGASGCAAGTIVTATFGSTYTTPPMVVVTPGDSVTAGENLNYYVTPATGNFVLGTQNTTTTSKTLIFYYHVIR